MWLVVTGLAGIASISAVLTRTNGYLLIPWTSTALVAMGFTAYHNSARDAGAAVARPIFSIAGPLLSVSVALLIVDLAERRSALDKKRTIS